VARSPLVHGLDVSSDFANGSAGRSGLVTRNLAVRFVLELCAYASLAYWGVSRNAPVSERTALAVFTPLAAMAVWSAWLAPKARRHLSESAALILELIVFGLAATALASSSSVTFGVLLGAAAAANAVLLRLIGHKITGAVAAGT
jgi:hypothetical protein